MCQETTIKQITVCGIRVDMVQAPGVIEIIERWIESKDFGNYIVFSNVNNCVLSRKNKEVREAVNKSSLSVPDGISLVLSARLYGYPLRKRVYGSDLMLEILKISEAKGYSNFFYGSGQETLDSLIKNLKMRYPRLNIAGNYSPPFRKLTQDEDREIVDIINKSSPDVLWVGLGCPKQELWMYEHREKLRVPVMLGVGAAFDFVAGTKPQAPIWIRDHGFEWLFRLITEPRRLWRRYIINGSIFIYYIGKQVINDFLNNKLAISREK